jgi:hypothetical protein
MRRFRILFLLAFWSCIDPISFDTPRVDFQMVVDGVITNEPPPYTVRLYRALALDADQDRRVVVRYAKVTLRNDLGQEEEMKETEDGVYRSAGLIKGEIGHTYAIRIQTVEGRIFESTPDTMLPTGAIEAITFEFDEQTVLRNGVEQGADRFNIFVSARGAIEGENRFRWRMTGTYEIETFPQFRTRNAEGGPVPDPPPCSGYEVRFGQLTRVRDCTCCFCWVEDFESVPKVADDRFVTGSRFEAIKVGEVPITRRTFYNKYRVTIEQMSLSPAAFTYWSLLRAQKQGAASLFQPPSGKVTGNIFPVNNTAEGLGIFWASAIDRKSVFIERQDIPYRVQPIDTLKVACTGLPNSSSTKPASWQ